MAHAVQKVVQRCEDCENNGGSMGKNFIIYPSFCVIKKCLFKNQFFVKCKNTDATTSLVIPREKC